MALFIIADDSHRINRMKGRGGYTDSVIPPRRKPVSIEDVDHIYTGSRKAARISDFANEDSEDLSRRSHKKDRKLLDDITTKLVNSSYTEPIKLPRARRPPVGPVGRKPVVPSSGGNRSRRVGIRPVPAVPLHSYRRASSVPPRYVEEEVVTPYNFYEVPTPPRSYYYKAYRPPPVRSQPQYTGAFRAASEPPLTRSSTLAVKNARRCLDRIERELGVDDGELYSSAPPPAAPSMAREVRARTANRGGGGARAGAVRRRPGSLPPSASRNRINQAEIEREVEEYLERPVVRASARSRAASLERPRIPSAAALPSYSPLLGRRSSLSGPIERMPGLDPYRPKQGSSGSNYGSNSGAGVGGYGTAIAPYTPARITKPAPIGGLPPKGFYRTNSDNRNRIRYVICYLKNNPYHFSRW